MAKKGFNGLMAMAITESNNQFGNDFNNSEDSEFYKLTASLMPMFVFLEDKVISLKRDMNLYTCQGQALDDILNNDIFYRIVGNKSTGIFEVTGNNSVFVAIGEIQVEAYNGETFTNTTSGMVSSGTVNLEFKSDSATSSANIPANNIERVIKAPSGITDVQNTNKTVDGLNTETDYEYLNRYLQSSSSEAWTLSSIIENVRKVPGVTSVSGDRNNTLTDNTGGGGLPPKSIRIVVKGGVNKDICEAIYEKIHTPITVGLQNYDVEIFPGKKENIKFDRPKITKIDYQYSILADKKTEIISLIDEYLDELGVGDFISLEEFRNKKIGDSKEYGIKGMAISFKRESETPYVNFLQLNFDEEGQKGTGVEK